MILNQDLRKTIVDLVRNANEGHIPSSFSIVDIIDYLYGNILKYDTKAVDSPNRDYFILSKGHAALALYVVLEKYGIISRRELLNYGNANSPLGGHPDRLTTPGVEASTGSLGHGFPMAVGVAMGLKISNLNNRVFVLVGDGECQEGTIWEAANIATNQKLNNICVIVDWNGSAQQLMPIENLELKWQAFGWKTKIIDGHSESDLESTFLNSKLFGGNAPIAVLAKNIKGKGVSFIEGHGSWHHKVPNDHEYAEFLKELDK
jgi:transketolase